jgi:hypothetical protein
MLKVRRLPFALRHKWFRREVGRLRCRGGKRIVVSRGSVLEDSAACFAQMSRADLRRRMTVEFVGEPAVDAGGVKREWFDLLSSELFRPSFALFRRVAGRGGSAGSYDVNPASRVALGEEARAWFRFAGRVLGKALLEGVSVRPRLSLVLRAHLAGCPVGLEALRSVDPETAAGLASLLSASEDAVGDADLDFCVTETDFGQHRDVDLVPGGRGVAVTAGNRAEYVSLVARRALLGRAAEQTEQLIRGVYEVVPHALLAAFAPREMALLLNGLAVIDLDDWKRHTVYEGGSLGRRGASHPLAKRFWRVVERFSAVERALLLQFVTGSRTPPVGGFEHLVSTDGKTHKFALHLSGRMGSRSASDALPRCHTCFNRLELPGYRSADVMRRQLLRALEYEATGFGLQ